MRIFLAGATGVLGRRILPILVSHGHQVTALTRQPEAVEVIRSAGGNATVGDVYDANALSELLAKIKPDLVMHQLTDLSERISERNAAIRTRGTRNLVDAALSAGVKKMVAQSVSWAYEPGDTPAGEMTPLDHASVEPRATTVRGVAALEATVAEMPSWVILRYGLLYGPDTWYSPTGMMADKARRRELPRTPDISSFIHVDDAADAAIRALAWRSGAVNICDDEPASGTEWIPVFARSVGAESPNITDLPARKPWARGADNSLARHLRDWRPQYPTWREHFLPSDTERKSFEL